MRNRLRILLAEKGMREQRTLSIRRAAGESKLEVNALTRFANNKLKHLPAEMLDVLCSYLECDIGDLLEHDPVNWKERE